MPTSTKSPKPSFEVIYAKLCDISVQLDRLAASVDLDAAYALHKDVLRSVRRHLDPQRSDLKELAEEMTGEIGAEMAERVVAAAMLRVEPILPLLMQMGLAFCEDHGIKIPGLTGGE